MGRWLKKIGSMPELEPTKLTKPSSVGFVTTDLEHIEGNNLNLINFVTLCCKEFNVEAPQVIDNLLSNEDQQEIISGKISDKVLRKSIEIWVAGGMLSHYRNGG